MTLEQAQKLVRYMQGKVLWADADDFAEERITLDGQFDEEDLTALLMWMRHEKKMVGGTGIGPVTPCMSSKCSTAELTAPKTRPERLPYGVCMCNDAVCMCR